MGHAVQCRGRSKSGDRCRNQSIHSSFCYAHQKQQYFADVHRKHPKKTRSKRSRPRSGVSSLEDNLLRVVGKFDLFRRRESTGRRDAASSHGSRPSQKTYNGRLVDIFAKLVRKRVGRMRARKAKHVQGGNATAATPARRRERTRPSKHAARYKILTLADIESGLPDPRKVSFAVSASVANKMTALFGALPFKANGVLIMKQLQGRPVYGVSKTSLKEGVSMDNGDYTSIKTRMAEVARLTFVKSKDKDAAWNVEYSNPRIGLHEDMPANAGDFLLFVAS